MSGNLLSTFLDISFEPVQLNQLRLRAIHSQLTNLDLQFDLQDNRLFQFFCRSELPLLINHSPLAVRD
jgi:hypothetical protein